MEEYGIPRERIYLDQISGGSFLRPQYRKLMKKLAKGDVLVIKSIDRLGRNYEEILEQWRLITKETGADIHVLDMPLLNTDSSQGDLIGVFIADLALQILAYVAETERSLIRQRQAEGIAVAKKNGVKFGGKKADVPEHFETYFEKWRDGEISLRRAAADLDMSCSTFYRRCCEKLEERKKINKSVTVIGTSAFYGCHSLIKAEIPKSVSSIGNSAFSNCCNLSEITIPERVSHIGIFAFNGCRNLTEITVDKKNITYDSRDHCNAIIATKTNQLIVGCCNTKIPDSVSAIGDRAFSGCCDLKEISIPEGVSDIGDFAFEGCTGLTEITLPESVTAIGNFAFEGCTGLAKITIPDSVSSIGINPFSCCSGLTEIQVGKENTTYDSRENCNAVIVTKSNELIIGCCHTKMPDSLCGIGDYAFDGCHSLTEITIPDSVSRIGNSAFFGCTGLTELVIPDGVSFLYQHDITHA